MNYSRLSKTLSHVLRHDPEAYGLALDPEGWVGTDELLAALRKQSSAWAALQEADLRAMIEQSAKRRYELVEHRIRALYGHSTPVRIAREAKSPPDRLYHGTTPAYAAAILAQGLKPMGRQYVHLSPDRNTALEVGRRRAARPVILLVRSREASQSGVLFYEGIPAVWLADYVPAEFISPADSNDPRL